eukprot:TRINITY_DN4434_c0_g1_i1.p1 TRINITY_DN4434_c0_g1~~TRINITY_DN4434_c0_g1_i1.p1  ORF type:complete len:742 (-),score=161.29 TRINITY_DN4434_c0_g1_i1:120-2345(-)
MEAIEGRRHRRMNCFKTEGDPKYPSRPSSRSSTYRRLSPIEASPSSSQSSLNTTAKCTGFVPQIGIPTQCNACFRDISEHKGKSSSNRIQRTRARYYNIHPPASQSVSFKNDDSTYKSLPASPSAQRKFASNGGGHSERERCSRSGRHSSGANDTKVYKSFRLKNGCVSLPTTPMDSRKTSPERRRSSVTQYDTGSMTPPHNYSLRNCRSFSDVPSKLCPPFSRRHATIQEEAGHHSHHHQHHHNHQQRNNEWESQSSRSYCSSIVSNSNNSSRAPSPCMSVMSERCPPVNGSLPRNFSYTRNEESKRRFIMNNFKSHSYEPRGNDEGVVSTMKRRLSEKLSASDFERTVLKQYVRPSHEHLIVDKSSIQSRRRDGSFSSRRANTAVTTSKKSSSSSPMRQGSPASLTGSSASSNLNNQIDRYASYTVVLDIIEAVMKDVVYESNREEVLNNEGDKVSKPSVIDSISKLDNLKDSSSSIRNKLDKRSNEKSLSRGSSHSKEIVPSMNGAPNLKNSSSQELEDILLQCTSKSSKDYPQLPDVKIAYKIKGKSRSSTPVIFKKDGRKKALWQKQVSNVNSLKQEAEELRERVRQLEELDSFADNIQDKEYAQLQVGYLKHEIKALEDKLNESDNKCFDLLEENVILKTEIDTLADEVYEVQDTFRDKDALEWKKLKAQLDVINKNCRNYQLKLRKAQLRTAELKAKNEELSASLKSDKAGTVTKFAIAIACLVAGYQIISKWK